MDFCSSTVVKTASLSQKQINVPSILAKQKYLTASSYSNVALNALNNWRLKAALKFQLSFFFKCNIVSWYSCDCLGWSQELSNAWIRTHRAVLSMSRSLWIEPWSILSIWLETSAMTTLRYRLLVLLPKRIQVDSCFAVGKSTSLYLLNYLCCL